MRKTVLATIGVGGAALAGVALYIVYSRRSLQPVITQTSNEHSELFDALATAGWPEGQLSLEPAAEASIAIRGTHGYHVIMTLVRPPASISPQPTYRIAYIARHSRSWKVQELPALMQQRAAKIGVPKKDVDRLLDELVMQPHYH